MAKSENVLSVLNTLCGAEIEDEHFDEFLPSGSVIFDSVVSNGQGIPRGKFIQLSSESGLGKSTTALFICKALADQGYYSLYLDVEKSVNKSQLDGIGLTPYLGTNFFRKEIATFEQAEELLDQVLVENDEKLALVVVDSLTAMIPQKMLENSVTATEPGLHARSVGAFLTKYKHKLSLVNSKATFLFLNQLRTKISFVRTTIEEAGGMSQKFSMDVRLHMKLNKKLLKKTETIEGKVEVPYGNDINLFATKNRFNRPMVEGVMTIFFGRGISNAMAYQHWLQKNSYITQAGAYYTISLPNKEPEKIRGSVGVSKWVKEHVGEIAPLVEANGGFLLVREDEEE